MPRAEELRSAPHSSGSAEQGAPDAEGRVTIATVGLAAAPTWLSTRLSQHTAAAEAFDAARRAFISSRRVDMSALAAELGVDRTSLFRWVGNRDALLSEVLWSLAVPTLVHAEKANLDSIGVVRVAGILSDFVDALIQAPYFRDFLRREPARSLRLLTTKGSEIQRRYVATVEWLVRRDLGERALTRVVGDREIDPRTLAYLLVRVSESFSYSDLIAGEPPSTESARAVLRMLLRAD